ncbi:hypothetical protein NMG60_11009278 [Bertholletia excelsa]
MAAPAPTLNFFGVLSESKRIVSAHSRHFLALSVLFLLPLSFSFIIFPNLENTLFQSQSQSRSTQVLLRSFDRSNYEIHAFSLKRLALPLAYALFAFLFSLCATATVTHSILHGFYGRPVKLAATVKSLRHSFFPLAFTRVAAGFVIALVCSAFGLFLFVVSKAVELLGFEIDHSSNYFIGFCIVLLVVLGLVMVYVQVNWSLAGVIVVAESKWGFECLRRSSYLVKGMRTLSLSLMLFFGFVIGVLLWVGSATTSYASVSNVWRCLGFVMQTVVCSGFATMLMLYSLASSTVLYMYCKALHGELAWEIAEEFAREYVTLPFDDSKVPHVVFVAQA